MREQALHDGGELLHLCAMLSRRDLDVQYVRPRRGRRRRGRQLMLVAEDLGSALPGTTGYK